MSSNNPMVGTSVILARNIADLLLLQINSDFSGGSFTKDQAIQRYGDDHGNLRPSIAHSRQKYRIANLLGLLVENGALEQSGITYWRRTR